MTALLAMNPQPAESEALERPKAPMRFAYATGARPLEGYTIKRGVGRGGFGEVYFAVSDAGKEVALKLIRRNLDIELRGVTHCLNLKHPNLISVYDIRTDDHDDHWVVMEYVSGASLEDVVDRHPNGMPRDLVLHWFEGICAAVAYLHDHGIVHRDLKPANIFLDEGRVKIGDYGLSKFISCSRRSGQTESVGTVHYMAPEIANGRYGREIDSYALGIILYEMLTGHVPFEGESVGEVLMKHLTAEPDLTGLEDPYRSVVAGAMAKDPERRINNAADMWAMLRGERPAISPTPSPVGAATIPYPYPSAPSSPIPPLTPPNHAAAGGSGPKPPAFFTHGDEPIMAAVRQGIRNVGEQVNWKNWKPLQKVLVAVPAGIVLMSSSEAWIPPVTILSIAYLGYRLVRAIILQSQGPPPAPQVPTAPSSAPAPSYAASAAPQTAPVRAKPASALAHTRPWRRRQASWLHAAHAHLATRPMRDKTSELLGSMLMSAGVAMAAALFISVMSRPHFEVAFFLWNAIVITAGSWAILAPAKLTEGRVEDQTPLRFMQLALGAAVGALAWLTASASVLSLPAGKDFSVPPGDSLFASWFQWRDAALTSQFQTGSVMMPVTMFMAYFAFTFVILRWWRQVEWTRSSRVSLWAVAWCGFIGWLTTFFWWFPQPLGALVCGAIALSVQLASPWLPPSQRRKFAESASTGAAI